MSLHKLIAATAAGFLAVAAGVGTIATAAGTPAGPTPVARPEPKPKPPSDRDLLHGEWLFDAATDEHGNDALNGPYREARLTFNKDQVAITQSPVSAAPVGTTFTIDPTATPKRMDWEVPALYRTLLRIPAGTARGIYKFEDADTLTVCMSNSPLADRPKEFKAGGGNHFLFTVKRWKGDPGAKLTTATVKVVDPDWKPADGIEVFAGEQRYPDQQPPRTWLSVGRTVNGQLTVDPSKVTGLIARDPARGLVGVVKTTPARLHYGITLRLAPAVRISGTLSCPELAAAGTSIGWTNVYLQSDGYSWSGYAATDGTFQFSAPAGSYTLIAYGERVRGKKVPLDVPAGRAEVDSGTMELTSNDWGKRIGKPAPELADIADWQGAPVHLAELKGQVVALYFLPPTAPPLTVNLSDLFAVADRYKERGLRVVGISISRSVDTDAVTKFKAAMAEAARQKEGRPGWPFPIARTVGDDKYDIPSLVTKARSRVAADYGVESWPFGVLIDRKGIVRGAFAPNVARDVELLDKLLAEK